MKKLMIRVLAIFLLAMSSASFASASEARHNHAKPSGEQHGGRSTATEQANKDSKQKTGERSQQEQEFDRVLMGIYG